MDASVIVTTFNQAKLLEAILLSLSHQETKFSYEIIVCDDGGINSTNNIVQKFHRDTPEIPIYYLWQQNRRFRAGQARNMGIRQANGNIIILIDGDMIPSYDFVQKHILFHLKHPKTLLTGSRKVIDDKVFFKSFQKKSSSKKLIKILRGKSVYNKEELQTRRGWYKSSKPWKSVFSCNLSFPKNQIGRYSEQFIGWGIEDWDFSLRMFKAGYSIHFSEELLAYHIDYKPVISNAFRNNNHLQMVEFARNALLLLDQYPSEDLDNCAIALNNYTLSKNKWRWAGDSNKLRDYQDSIKLLREWLKSNNYYSKDKLFIEPIYKASVVIACYQHLDYFEMIVYALQKQYDNDFEIILVDDGSNYKTIAGYQKLLNRLLVPSKIVWQPKDGFRVAKSRNNGIKQALGDVLIFLDGDMIPSNTLVTKHITFHANNKKSVLAGNRLILPESSFNRLRKNSNFDKQLIKSAIHFKGEESFRKIVVKSNKFTWRLGFTCNLSVKKALLPYFDENIQNKFGHEDLELMYRLALAGYSFKYDNKLIAYHIGKKKPGYAVHENATHDEIVRHLLTSLYLVNKHHDEKFMWAFLDCSRYFHLNSDGQWYFQLNKPKSISEGLTDFSSWLLLKEFSSDT